MRAVPWRLRLWRVCVLLALLVPLIGGAAVLPSCAHNANRRSGQSGGGDEDLLDILPTGLDAILDVETATLRAEPTGATLWTLLPAGARKLLDELAADPLADLDAICAGVTNLGTEAVDVVLVARGRPSWSRLLAAQVRQGGTASEYHGVPLVEAPGPSTPGSGRAAAQLSPRSVVLGSGVAVRQVIDNYLGDGDSARSQAPLMAALLRAPRAQKGRPAVLLAAVTTAPLRERMQQFDPLSWGADASFLAAALAAGDGIDLGVVAGYRDLLLAREAARRLREGVEGLRGRAGLAAFGLARFLEPLVVVAAPAGGRRATPEVHLAYRLPGDDLRALLSLIGRMRSTVGR